MAARKPTAAEMAFLLLFHATLSGAFLVAYLTGDEDTYRMHVFSGYAALAALAALLVEDLHEALGEVAPWIVVGHIALVLALHRLKRPRPRGATA